METLAVHFMLIFRNLENPQKHLTINDALSGENLCGRMGVIIEAVAAQQRAAGWELVAVSHAFLPEHQVRLLTK